jgi:hypothetical protein
MVHWASRERRTFAWGATGGRFDWRRIDVRSSDYHSDTQHSFQIHLKPRSKKSSVRPSIAKNDPFWLDPKDPHVVAYVQQGLLGPTVPNFWVFNPAVAQVQNEHVWSVGWTDVMQGGMTREAAAEKAFKRIEEILAKYPIAQA